MAALLLRSRADLTVDRAWTWLVDAATDLPVLVRAADPRLTLTLGEIESGLHRMAMHLERGAVTGRFELAVVTEEDGAATIVWSGDVPEALEDELEAVLVLQTVFRRWVRIVAQPEPPAPG